MWDFEQCLPKVLDRQLMFEAELLQRGVEHGDISRFVPFKRLEALIGERDSRDIGSLLDIEAGIVRSSTPSRCFPLFLSFGREFYRIERHHC